jgi:epoxyqueuosine reductase
MTMAQKTKTETDVWPANSEMGNPVTWQQFAESDKEAGFEILDTFERFSQHDDIFNRAWWDEKMMSPDVYAFYDSQRNPKPRRGEGFTQWDFALVNSAWSVARDYAMRGLRTSGIREGFLDPFKSFLPKAATKADLPDPADTAARVKQVARFLGADLVGITQYDPRWIYTHSADATSKTRDEKPNPMPDGMTSVIVLGHEMDEGLVKSYPSALAAASTGREYSREAAIVSSLASFIQALGYEAVGSSNDTGIIIPLAIKAGMGEYGRNQMIITPEFGPRIRFSKVFTNLPLVHDKPRKFGARQYCDICDKCAKACPPKALPFGPPTEAGPNRSTIKGVRKWSADCEKCFNFWIKMKIDCAICMRVCPYNRDYSKLPARLLRWLMGSRWRKLALWINNRSNHGERRSPSSWWARAGD